MPISLFYYYADIDNVDGMANRLHLKGSRLGLGGRIRVSPEGINGTFGGDDDSVKMFHDAVIHELNGAHIDFKVAPGGAKHFGNKWQVRQCPEVVTLGVGGHDANWRDAAPHLDPEEFRDEVMRARDEQGTLVVLDARNAYESAIGRFDNAILPQIRQFSDFALFVRRNAELFRGKRVLMYCTGGVRCERGSALVRRVTDADSVAQLKGGIDTFIKRFPDGGDVFKGKNLVFDQRMAVGTLNRTVVGKCFCCEGPWDDYSAQWRCTHCRCRILVCDKEDCTNMWTGDVWNSLCSVCSQGGKESRAHESDSTSNIHTIFPYPLKSTPT